MRWVSRSRGLQYCGSLGLNSIMVRCFVDWAGKMPTPQEFRFIEFAFLGYISLCCKEVTASHPIRFQAGFVIWCMGK
jgi:hypothetical protein